jgi:hypothetical protein
VDMEEASRSEPDSGSMESVHHMPRWVKVFLIAGGVVVLCLVLLAALSGGEHGPLRHGASARASALAQTAHTSAIGGG